MNITIRNYEKSDIDKIVELQKKYTNKYPDAPVLGARVYDYPEFENGKNIFCAFDEKNRLLAYAPIFPKLVNDDSPMENPHNLWIEIKPDIDLENQNKVKEMLYEKVIERANEIKKSLPERKIRLGVVYFACETEGTQYFLSKGFENYENMYEMRRDLFEPILDLEVPSGVEIKKWKMETEEEKLKYIKADNLAFPHSPKTLERLKYFMNSEMWSVGTAISAFNENAEVVGSLMAYWSEKENKDNVKKIGDTEEIFVIPDYRGRGIAKYLIEEGLNFLKEHGLDEARLEVVSNNENALKLYKSMGYKVHKHELLLGRFI